MTLVTGIPDALQPYARAWVNQPKPEGHRHRMKRGACYYNAARLCLDFPFTYVEGVAGLAGQVVPHAWVVDDRGFVIDRTWKYDPAAIYFGVPFRDAFIA